MSGPHAAEWKVAIAEELKNMSDLETWELVPRPKNCNVIGSTWVFDVQKSALIAQL